MLNHDKICSLVVLMLLGATPAPAETPPNILMIVTDDQGAWTMGCSGNADALTPNMDRLSAEGVRFENAFVVTPVCSPSRLATLTGRYASEFGIFDWINPQAEPDLGIPSATPTWPSLLQNAGYRTGLVGKWHLGLLPKHHPKLFGYEFFAGFLGGGTATKNPILTIDGETKQCEGLCVDLLTDLAVDFLKVEDSRPWCLSLHFRAPHAAYLPVQEELWKQFENRQVAIPHYPDLDLDRVTPKMREYLASVADVDRNLGRILQTLDELRLTQNTLVIFTSDHGYNMGHHGLEFKGNAFWRLRATPQKVWPLIDARRRPNLFDSSLRVPLIVRWPGHVEAGTISDAWTTNLDWFPTLCRVAHVPQQRTIQLSLRGQGIDPLVQESRDFPAALDDRTMYFEYSMHHGSKTAMRAIRTEKWKWMRDFANSGRVELYDLENDPQELTNVAEEPLHADAIEMLDRRLLEHMQAVKDPELTSVKR